MAIFTGQLVESNPILTDISDCMTAEGKALAAGDTAGAATWGAKKADANASKGPKGKGPGKGKGEEGKSGD